MGCAIEVEPHGSVGVENAFNQDRRAIATTGSLGAISFAAASPVQVIPANIADAAAARGTGRVIVCVVGHGLGGEFSVQAN